ncbi:MAG: MBL fold metallo-hydrolase [Candidatus Micrarchaeota archaeon]|nr:MBL fold metallo-hydrolase [Candidatus Micrarchaeota archaeon]
MEYGFVRWLGHASFLIRTGDLNVFIDPFKLPDVVEKADMIFITHPHFDHMHEESIAKIETPKTHFVMPHEAATKLRRKNVTVVSPGDSGEVLGIKFEAVPAYNNKPEKMRFHQKTNGWVGYIITANGKRIYHPGDTDLIDEMGDIDVDLALLPCGGTYVMDIDDAIRATKVIRAEHFAMMHYKTVLGKEKSEEAEKKFKENVKNAVWFEDENPIYSF